MVRISPKQLDKAIKKQDEDTYGTGHTDGDHDVIGNTEDNLEDVIGNKPDPQKVGFSIAEEIDSDEAALAEE